MLGGRPTWLTPPYSMPVCAHRFIHCGKGDFANLEPLADDSIDICSVRGPDQARCHDLTLRRAGRPLQRSSRRR